MLKFQNKPSEARGNLNLTETQCHGTLVNVGCRSESLDGSSIIAVTLRRAPGSVTVSPSCHQRAVSITTTISSHWFNHYPDFNFFPVAGLEQEEYS
jgi:hypothetical protein